VLLAGEDGHGCPVPLLSHAARSRAVDGVGEIQGPGGDSVPGAGLRDGKAELLSNDEEGAGPESGAMKFAGGEEVVGGDEEHEAIGDQGGGEEFVVDRSERPTNYRGYQQRGGGDENQALVRGRIKAVAEGEEHEDAEKEHVRDRDDVESFRVDACRSKAAAEPIGAGDRT
jgi:hypothetical protein